MGQRWTVAILRFGDEQAVEGQPFGPETQPAEPTGGQVNVDVRVVGVEAGIASSQQPPQMNTRAREILKNELVKSEQFTVVERERILEILREINFGASRYVDPETSPEAGKLLCVRYLIEGSMGLNEDKTLKDTLESEGSYKDAPPPQPDLWDNLFNPSGVRSQQMYDALQQARKRWANEQHRQEYPYSCYLSLYDVRTGEVKVSVMGLGSNGLEAIRDAVDELIDDLVDKDDGIRVAAVVGEKIYLDIGSQGGIKVGDRYQVVHLGTEIRNRHGQVIGYEQSEVGEIEVFAVQDYMSQAKIVTKAGDITRGDRVKPATH